MEHDYNWYMTESKELKDELWQAQADREKAMINATKSKTEMMERVQDLEEESNSKITKLSNKLMMATQALWDKENETTDVIQKQEALIQKWKTQHLTTIDYYTKLIQV